jgi:chromosome partitioning protein
MFIISLIGQKGGTGKTTAALGLAVAATRAGKVVAVIDIDPQATAANWKDRRGKGDPAVVSAQASRLRQTLDAARQGGAEFAFVDTAGRNDDSALNAARLSDLVLIPSRPNMVEIETLKAVADLMRLAGNPPAFVLLNGIHPAATRQADEAREMVTQIFGLACTPVHLCHRTAYAEAPMTGKSPQEIDPDGKAGIELDKLFMFVSDFVNKGTSAHVQNDRAPSAA